MANRLNKHTPDSEELLKRLNSNDSSGLDDFEKEALEGFDSLDNAELAKNLTDSVNRKIDEKYFQQNTGSKKGMMYLSLAAGLVLVVGLSIFFMNIMGDKKEMAMSSDTLSTENIANEVAKPADIAPMEEPAKAEGKKSGELNTITVTDALAEKSPENNKDISAGDKRAKADEDKGDGLTSRLVVKETKPAQTVPASEGEADFKKQVETKTSSGPPTGNNAPSSPVLAMDDKKASDKEATTEKITLSKNNGDDNMQAESGSGKASGVKKRAAPKKEKAKSEEYLGNEDAAKDEATVKVASNTNQAATGGITTAEPKRDESGNVHNIEYSNHGYYKPQDYLKVEINKSEMLKTNVKAFKAELTINEKGTVTEVKFLTPFDNSCTGCKKELEKILLKMPGWKPSAATKTVKETVSYIDN